jgi:formylglycine-generating enzyme required for sulfatase activity
MPLLPPQLQTFTARTTLKSLLTLHAAEMPDVNFIDLTPQEIRPYIYLTHRVEAQIEMPTEMPQPEMVHIPAGEFTMGSDEYADEKPVHRMYLPDFQIGRYPVTNFEYRAFVRDSGVNPPPHWEGSDYPEALGDHPVVHVTWYEARAYCEWLSEKTGRAYRLPTEAEWEKAARGPDGQRWPWGNEWDTSHCNSRESDLRQTTPPGQYSPQGDSPYGAADMAGNVWEWCHSLFWPYAYLNDDGREDSHSPAERALRGGAFSNRSGSVRCAFRYRHLPHSHDKDIGFRVALSFPENSQADPHTSPVKSPNVP